MLIDALTAAMGEQTVTVPGTRAAELVLLKLAITLGERLEQREQAACQIEEMLDTHPLSTIPTPMPGIGVRTGARILLEVGDGSSFPTSGHLAPYAGLAPVTRRSGTSRGQHPARGGNKQLKRAFVLPASASPSGPTSRTYYARKRAVDNKHSAARIFLARGRIDVPHAKLRNGALYQKRLPRPIGPRPSGLLAGEAGWLLERV